MGHFLRWVLGSNSKPPDFRASTWELIFEFPSIFLLIYYTLKQSPGVTPQLHCSGFNLSLQLRGDHLVKPNRILFAEIVEWGISLEVVCELVAYNSNGDCHIPSNSNLSKVQKYHECIVSQIYGSQSDLTFSKSTFEYQES